MSSSAPSDGTTGALAHRGAELHHIVGWALDRVWHHLHRYGVRLTLGGGQLGDTFVGVDEVRRVLGRPAAETVEAREAAAAEQPRFDLTERLGIAPRAEAVVAPGAAPGAMPGAAATLRERFGLDDIALRLLLAAAAPQLSLDIARLYTFAWADFTVRHPPVGFLAELVALSPSEVLAAHAAFRPDAPLVRHGLVGLAADAHGAGERAGEGRAGDGWAGALRSDDLPPTHRGVMVPAAVVAFLRGEPPWLSGRLADAVRFTAPAAVDDDIAREPSVVRLRAIFKASESSEGSPANGVQVLLIGDPGAGRERALAAVLAGRGQALVTVDLDALPSEPAPFVAAVAEALREARLRAAVPLLRGDQLFADADDARLLPLARLLARTMPGRSVVLAAPQPVGALQQHLDALQPLVFARPSAPQQLALWRAALAAGGVDDVELPARLVQRFSVSPGAIARAARQGMRDARLIGEAPGLEHIGAALRRHINHALDALAEPLSTTLTWDDVVLPPVVVETLHELRAQARHRLQVFDEWGFRRKMSYGRGLGCLFTGPPGTGKTMMAGIIAQDLGRELYRVDLSRVVSKWVGETEKNLARIFDEAERAQVILFFDEADSLFSTRTEVKGANDRFANMEVNFLLQRMESFDGMTILTTNFERSIDEAFKRRLRFRVHFPLPEADERATLWARMIPVEMPVEGDIDFALLGRRYKMSGGNIKNAVLRAAFHAADGAGRLTHALLIRAAEAESREMGRL